MRYAFSPMTVKIITLKEEKYYQCQTNTVKKIQAEKELTIQEHFSMWKKEAEEKIQGKNQSHNSLLSTFHKFLLGTFHQLLLILPSPLLPSRILYVPLPSRQVWQQCPNLVFTCSCVVCVQMREILSPHLANGYST